MTAPSTYDRLDEARRDYIMQEAPEDRNQARLNAADLERTGREVGRCSTVVEDRDWYILDAARTETQDEMEQAIIIAAAWLEIEENGK